MPVHAVKRFNPAVHEHVPADVVLARLIIEVNVDAPTRLPMEVHVEDQVIPQVLRLRRDA
jgi:hypothetical protein